MGVRNRYKWFRYNFRRVFLYITFLGVVIHEFAHKKLCDHYHIPVDEVCYFQFDSPPGYVTHAQPRGYTPSVLISIAPIVINTVFALIAGITAGYVFDHMVSFSDMQSSVIPVGVIVVSIWIGVSSGVHLLPSQEDAGNIWNSTKRNWYNPLILIGIPTALFLEIFNRLYFLYIDVIVGISVFIFGWYAGRNHNIVLKLLMDSFYALG